MGVQVSFDRDYLGEIKGGLETIFNGELIHLNWHIQTYPQIYHGSPFHPVPYDIRISVMVSNRALMQQPHIPFNYSDLSIGPYVPVCLNQTQDEHWHGHYINIVYRTENLDDFVNEVQKKAWHCYNTKMNDAIDKVLSN